MLIALSLFFLLPAALFSVPAGTPQAFETPTIRVAMHGGEIRHVELEEYTQGVIQTEMAGDWPAEALKAQAILARTNALRAHRHPRHARYDVTDTLPQAFAVAQSTTRASRQAMQETRGMVLSYRGKEIPAFFHAMCGGATEAVGNVWEDIRPYTGAVSCPHCKSAPKFRWNHRISLHRLRRVLKRAGTDLGPIRAIEAHRVSRESGRVVHLAIVHSRGRWIVPSDQLRGWLGHAALRSTQFRVERQGAYALFRGRGWGHGVGLCQWGAKAMAEQGRSYSEILSFYFPGARVESADNQEVTPWPWQPSSSPSASPPKRASLPAKTMLFS